MYSHGRLCFSRNACSTARLPRALLHFLAYLTGQIHDIRAIL